MSAEENKAIARRYWDEVWSTGNVAIVDEIFAEGDKVVVRWTVHGTHRGNIEIESAGTIPPTGKPVSFAGMDIYHFRGGKIVEGWRHWSNLQLVQQLGVVLTAG